MDFVDVALDPDIFNDYLEKDRETPESSETHAFTPGSIYKGVSKLVEVVNQEPSRAVMLAGHTAMALQLALEADNVDPSEKRYARMKVFEALQKALDSITASMGTSTVGKLEAVLNVVMQEPDEGADL
jgi:hypothetical protein|nr:MAG TPA: hypothetical protein [Caudoviricetes sp.]DAT72613.1 MAG TPA: hypothetical protein [Caudoviricetes sp.]